MLSLAGFASLVALSTSLSACDVSPPAATVNGTTITQSQLNAQLGDITDTGQSGTYVRCALELDNSLPSSPSGAGDNTVTSQMASYQLSLMILQELISQDLARLGSPVTSSDMNAARQDLAAELEASASSGQGSPCGYSGSALLDRLPSSFASLQVRYLAEEERLAVVLGHVDLGEQGVAGYYLTHLPEFAQICVSVIGVSSQAQATSIEGAITSGATTFAQAARQSSLLTQSAQAGGNLGCVLTSSLQGSPLLSTIGVLPVGQVSSPVSESTTSGPIWLLFVVNARPEQSLAQSRAQIRNDLLSAQNSRLTSEFHRITRSANVTVDPRYGTWTKLRGVNPPVPPPKRYLLSPSANQPSTSGILSG